MHATTRDLSFPGVSLRTHRAVFTGRARSLVATLLGEYWQLM